MQFASSLNRIEEEKFYNAGTRSVSKIKPRVDPIRIGPVVDSLSLVCDQPTAVIKFPRIFVDSLGFWLFRGRYRRSGSMA